MISLSFAFYVISDLQWWVGIIRRVPLGLSFFLHIFPLSSQLLSCFMQSIFHSLLQALHFILITPSSYRSATLERFSDFIWSQDSQAMFIFQKMTLLGTPCLSWQHYLPLNFNFFCQRCNSFAAISSGSDCSHWGWVQSKSFLFFYWKIYRFYQVTSRSFRSPPLSLHHWRNLWLICHRKWWTPWYFWKFCQDSIWFKCFLQCLQ